MAGSPASTGDSVIAAHAGAEESWHRMTLRQILLVLVLVGIGGLVAELLLLGHTESFNQWIPLIVLTLGLVSALLLMVRPGRRSIRFFQLIMASFVIAGILGLYLHYRGNVEFALERYPEMRGVQLVWKALRGATPTLAPGALAQLGLLGLAYAYRHPAIREQTTTEAKPAIGTARGGK